MKRAILIGFTAALLSGYILKGTFYDCIGIASYAVCALMPFLDRKHVREGWAKSAFLFFGLIGMADSVVYLTLHERWLVVDTNANHVIHRLLSFAGGIIVGIVFTLMLSGQLLGTKRDDKEIKQGPVT
jgi:hypothetical protein